MSRGSSGPHLARPGRMLVLTLLLSWSLVVGLAATAYGKPGSSSAKEPKAITAMESKMSSLRRGPDGKAASAKQLAAAVGSQADQLGSSDLMGTPADKTIAHSQDRVLREDNESNVGEGNLTSVASYGLTADMSGTDGKPADIAVNGRATIDHRYPSVRGNFRSSTTESVLQFKSSVAGSDSIWQLGTTNAAAEKRTFDPAADDIDLTNGGTYVIKTGGTTAVTNASTQESGPVGAAAQLLDLVDKTNTQTPSYDQQWAVVPAAGAYQLISRADGLCLVHTTNDSSAEVITDECSTDPSRLWWVNDDFVPNLWRFQVGNDINRSPGLYGDGNSLKIGSPQYWEAHSVTEPGGSVPTWSTVRKGGYTAGNIAAPYAMAAGDLDGVTSADGTESSPGYHDEAAVAYTDSNDNWALRVVDYNARPGHLLVTAPDASIPFGKNGATVNNIWNPGDLIVEIGDFNGDGRNEIATAYQDGNGDFDFTFWRYTANSDGSRSLTLLSDCVGCAGRPFKNTPNMTLQQGYADSAVGDFDGDGRDDIAVAYANNVATTTANTGRTPHLGVWTLNTDLSTRSVAVIDPPTDSGDLAASMINDPARTPSGLQLVSGNLLSDPANGFGPQRSELALAWSAYNVGDHVYNPNTTKDEHPYKITPVVNIYSVSTDDCNNSLTTCDSSISPTNGKTAMQPLFPSNPSQTAYRNFGTGYNIPPMSLEVGAFGGTGTDDPPVDGLLASAWLEWNQNPNAGGTGTAYYTQQSIVVPWQKGDDTHTQWTITDTQQETGASNWQLTRYTSYDGLGTAVVLGAPSVLHLEQNIKENVVAAEPPSHVDWLNGGWSNVSASADFYLQTKSTSGKSLSSSTSNENSWNNGMTEGVDVKASWDTTIFPGVSSSGYVDVNQKFEKQWSGLSQTSGNTNTSWTTTTAAQTSQDDLFSYSSDDTLLYRYPIIGKPGVVDDGDSCSSGCRTYYDVYIPEGSVHLDNVAGKSTTLFQPDWQNMNALSYPVSSAAAPVPMPDLGSYSYTDSNGTPQTVDKVPLYNQVNDVGANVGSIDLDFAESEGSGTSNTHARTWKVGADVSVSGKVTVGVPGENASVEATASSGFDVSKSTTSTDTGSSTTSSDQEFTLNVPGGIDPGRAYRVGTAYYYSTDGAAKVVHGVDLTSNVQGRNWWITNYGQTPDPAFNLPGRIELTYDAGNTKTDNPLWLTAPQRQLIRGFQVLQATNDSTGLPTKGDPFTVNPVAGQQVTFEVPVHNYSLKPMSAGTTVNWYAVPVDQNDRTVTGPAVSLGASSTVPAIDAQKSVMVQSPVWTAPTGSTMQQYRIVARIDEAGTAADLHPLAGTACPVTSLEPNDNNSGDPALYDIMKPGTVADPLGCGQNNQGYGLVNVSPPAPPSVASERHATAKDPARAKLAGGGLIDTNLDHLRLTEKSEIPTVPAGQRVTGLVRASAAVHTGDQPLVVVYDGPVADGKIIAVTRMNGIDDETGGTATFSWKPDRPGVHELHQVLLGTRATGQDDVQIMRVRVAEPKDGYSVSAAASAPAVKPGAAYAVTGRIQPVPSRAWERTVELQRKIGSRWEAVETQQTSGSGRFDFDLKAEEKVATEQYRVRKLPTAGRQEALSPVVTVKVQTTVIPTYTVTAKAKPTKIKVRQRSTISGVLAPVPAAAGDRAVQLQLKRGSSWRKVASTTAKASGIYSFRVKPTKKGTYAYRVVKPATDGARTAYSSTVKVTASPATSIRGR